MQLGVALNSLRTVLIAAMVLGALLAVTFTLTASTVRGPRFTEQDECDFDARRAEVEADLIEGHQPEWAGTYWLPHDKGAINVMLSRSGFVSESSSCFGRGDRDWGSLSEHDGRIELTFGRSASLGDFIWHPSALRPQRLDGEMELARLRLPRADEQLSNSVDDASSDLLEAGFLRKMDVPAVEFHVTSVEARADEVDDGALIVVLRVALDVGDEAGASLGMKLVLHDASSAIQGELTELNETTSIAELRCEPGVVDRISVGTTLFNRRW